MAARWRTTPIQVVLVDDTLMINLKIININFVLKFWQEVSEISNPNMDMILFSD